MICHYKKNSFTGFFTDINIITMKLCFSSLSFSLSLSISNSLYQSLSCIPLGRSSRRHPLSSQSCWICLANRLTLVCPCERIGKRMLLISSWMCLWCNGYRRRKWTRQHEFKSKTRLIAFHIALMPLGKVWIQLFSLQLWVNSRAD